MLELRSQLVLKDKIMLNMKKNMNNINENSIIPEKDNQNLNYINYKDLKEKDSLIESYKQNTIKYELIY